MFIGYKFWFLQESSKINIISWWGERSSERQKNWPILYSQNAKKKQITHKKSKLNWEEFSRRTIYRGMNKEFSYLGFVTQNKDSCQGKKATLFLYTFFMVFVLKKVVFNDWRIFSLMHGSIVSQSCPTHCIPMNYSLPGSYLHGIFQARILEWVTIPFSRGSSPPGDQTQVSWIAGRFFTLWAIREAHYPWYGSILSLIKENGSVVP